MYFRRYTNIDKHSDRLIKLLKKYKELKKFSTQFTLNEIDNILKKKYLAREIVNDTTYLGLIDDPMVEVLNIVKLYEITNPKILKNLYTLEEVKIQKEFSSEKYEIEDEQELLWSNIQQGKILRIALESIDKNTVSSYTQQGESKRLAAELFVLSSSLVEEEIDLNDEFFQEYLEALFLAGYLVD